MSIENWLLSALAGLVIGWLANFMTKRRYSFLINLFVGLVGAILLNIFVKTLELIDEEFWPTLGVSIMGASLWLILFHITRLVERKLNHPK